MREEAGGTPFDQHAVYLRPENTVDRLVAARLSDETVHREGLRTACDAAAFGVLKPSDGDQIGIVRKTGDPHILHLAAERDLKFKVNLERLIHIERLGHRLEASAQNLTRMHR